MAHRVWRLVRILWIGAGLAFTAWMYIGFQTVALPSPDASAAERVVVTTDDTGTTFRPRSDARSAGLIFLPGGIVDPLAYSPLLHQLAVEGYTARLVKFPLRCACTGSQIQQVFSTILSIMAAEPEKQWILAGHSRGAMLAARFVNEKSPKLAGLVLIGTTHPRDFSLAGTRIPVTKIYGTRDGIAPHSDMLRNRHLLPPDTTWAGIEGGNHVQFGYYRHQLGDDPAEISRENQQAELKRLLLRALAPR